MANNFIYCGKTVEFTAAVAVLSSSPVVLGSLLGVALDNVAATEVGVASIEGVYELPKKTGAGLALGDLVDFDVSAQEIAEIATPAAGDLVGCAVVVADAATADTVVHVKLNAGGATVTS